MGYTILVTERSLAPAGTGVLKRAGCKVLYLPRSDAVSEQVRVLGSEPVDAIIARGLPVTAEAVQASKTLRVISRHGVGYNHVDVPAATAAGVAVLIATGANAQSVAELAMGLMVAVARGVLTHDATIRSGGWLAPAPQVQLSGRTLGIVGIGAVGSKVARLCLAVGMTVVAHDPYVDAARLPDGVAMAPSLDSLLGQADVLSLHCPLTAETHGLIGPAEFARLRPGAIFINTARGPVADTEALVRALRTGQVIGAGLDTFDEEPLPAGSSLAELPNVVMTPHIGGSTEASLAAVSSMAAENALRVLRGEPVPPGACVNKSVLKSR